MEALAEVIVVKKMTRGIIKDDRTEGKIYGEF